MCNVRPPNLHLEGNDDKAIAALRAALPLLDRYVRQRLRAGGSAGSEAATRALR